MSFEVQLAHSVREIGPEAWDRLSGGRPFTSYRWYSYGEAVLADNTPIYIILHHQGEPAARATFWLRRREALPIASRLARRAVEAILHRWPLLLCSTPLADASGLILPDPPLRDEALGVIAQVALDQARRHRVSFVGCAYLSEQEARQAGWPRAFTAVDLPEPTTRLSIVWADFESYLCQLPPAARKDYRRHRNRAADLGIEIKPGAPATAIDEALTLIRNAERHHRSAFNPWARATLEHAALVDGVWLTAQAQGRLVGCGLLLRDGPAWLMTLLGRDYAVPYAYFQLMYAAIRCAIEGGAQVLWGGTGAYDLKRRLGFQLAENHDYAVFAGRGPLLQRLGRWVAAEEERKVTDPYRAGDRDGDRDRDRVIMNCVHRQA